MAALAATSIMPLTVHRFIGASSQSFCELFIFLDCIGGRIQVNRSRPSSVSMTYRSRCPFASNSIRWLPLDSADTVPTILPRPEILPRRLLTETPQEEEQQCPC